MVRNAFAFAENIHMRAAVAACPSIDDAEGSPMNDQGDGLGDQNNVHNVNVREEDEEVADSQTRPVHSNYSPEHSQETYQHGETMLMEATAQKKGRTACPRMERP